MIIVFFIDKTKTFTKQKHFSKKRKTHVWDNHIVKGGNINMGTRIVVVAVVAAAIGIGLFIKNKK